MLNWMGYATETAMGTWIPKPVYYPPKNVGPIRVRVGKHGNRTSMCKRCHGTEVVHDPKGKGRCPLKTCPECEGQYVEVAR